MFRPSKFSLANPEVWFLQCESQFMLNHITDDDIKYHSVVSVLPEEVAAAVIHVMRNPPTVAKYQTLRDAVLQHLSMGKNGDNICKQEERVQQQQTISEQDIDGYELPSNSYTEERFVPLSDDSDEEEDDKGFMEISAKVDMEKQQQQEIVEKTCDIRIATVRSLSDESATSTASTSSSAANSSSREKESPKSGGRVQCHICHKLLSGKVSLASHTANVHEGRKPSQCSSCNKSFFDVNSLKRHVASVHNKIRRFNCDQCEGVSFVDNTGLRRHKRSIHQQNTNVS